MKGLGEGFGEIIKGLERGIGQIETEIESEVVRPERVPPAVAASIAPASEGAELDGVLPASTAGTSPEATKEASHQEPSQLSSSLHQSLQQSLHQSLQQSLHQSQQQVLKLQAKLSEKSELVRDKDEQISAVLAEGEGLSKRQAEQELTIRRLRAALREAEAAAEEATATADALRERVGELEATVENGAPSQKSALLAEAHQSAAIDEAASQMDELRASLANALETQAKLSAQVFFLFSSHSPILPTCHTPVFPVVTFRSAVLSVAQVGELQAENERLCRAGQCRDSRLSSQLGELSARTDAAEAHARQLAVTAAQESAPLLRQLAAMEALQTRTESAWRAAEAELKQRLRAAEARADTAEEALATALADVDAAEMEAAELRRVQAKGALEAASARSEVASARSEADKSRATLEALQAQLAAESHVRDSAAVASAALLEESERQTQEAPARAEVVARAEVARAEVARAEAARAEAARRERERLEDRLRFVESELKAAQCGLAEAKARAEVGGASAAHIASRCAAPALQPAAGGGSAGNSPAELQGVSAEFQGMKRVLAATEAKEAALLAQLASLSHQRTRAETEAAALRSAHADLVVRFKELGDEHAIALELLGEKEEKKEEALGRSDAARQQ